MTRSHLNKKRLECQDSTKARIVNYLGIRETRVIRKYLSFPIMAGHSSRIDFNFTIDKIRSKLKTWNAIRLSLLQLLYATQVST
ncbi:hypothetical protein J1N35_025596, partial [Gossypium stocksii]